METSLEILQNYVREIDVEKTRIADLISKQLRLLQEGTINPAQLAENLDPVTANLRAIGTSENKSGR